MRKLTETPGVVDTTEAVTLEIRPNLLKAMALLSSDDSTRQPLQGVCLDYLNDTPVLVATDGRRLGVYSLENENKDGFLGETKGKQLIIPSSLIKKIPGSLPKLKNANHVEVTFEGDEVTLEVGSERKIPYSFPNWRQIIPSPDTAESMDQFVADAEYARDFQKVGTLLDLSKFNQSYPVFISHGPSGFSVYLDGHPEFYGVLMGVRLMNSRQFTPPVYA